MKRIILTALLVLFVGGGVKAYADPWEDLRRRQEAQQQEWRDRETQRMLRDQQNMLERQRWQRQADENDRRVREEEQQRQMKRLIEEQERSRRGW